MTGVAHFVHCNRSLVGSHLQIRPAGCTWRLCQHQPTQSNRIPWAGFSERCLGWPTLCWGGEGRYQGTGSTRDPCRHIATSTVTSFPSLYADTPVPHPHALPQGCRTALAARLQLCRDLPTALWLQHSAARQCSLSASPSASKYILLTCYFAGAVGA